MHVVLCCQRRQQAEAEHGHRAGGRPSHHPARRALQRHGPRRQAPALERAARRARQWQDARADVTQVSRERHS